MARIDVLYAIKKIIQDMGFNNIMIVSEIPEGRIMYDRKPCFYLVTQSSTADQENPLLHDYTVGITFVVESHRDTYGESSFIEGQELMSYLCRTFEVLNDSHDINYFAKVVGTNGPMIYQNPFIHIGTVVLEVNSTEMGGH